MTDFLKGLIDGLDPATLLPDLETLFAKLAPMAKIAVLAGPVVLLVMGAIYFFLAPKEANHTLGFRCWWGMSSVEVWQFTQKLAGATWMGLGLVLGIVALVSSGKYPDMGYQELMFSAISTIIWQICLVIVSIVLVNLILIILYDHKGYRRGTRPR